MPVTGPVPAGLIRYYCRYCKEAPADALPGSTVQCPKGHICKPKSKRKA